MDDDDMPSRPIRETTLLSISLLQLPNPCPLVELASVVLLPLWARFCTPIR